MYDRATTAAPARAGTRQLLFFLCLALLTLAGLVVGHCAATWLATPPMAPAPLPALPIEPTHMAEQPPPLLGEEPRPDVEPPRSAVAAPARPSFEDYVARLRTLALATTRAVLAGDVAAAKASDDEARSTLAALLRDHADADERALLGLLDKAAAPTTDEDRAHRTVLLRLVDLGLGRRADRWSGTKDRGELDHYVAAMLGSLPQDPSLAQDLGDNRLVGQRWLGSAHEGEVMELVELAGSGGFPIETATGLLVTLWQNLIASGERTSGELANLATLFLGDGNDSKLLAACRHLLLDPRRRDLVLELVRRRGDAALANKLGMVAGEQLPPGDALAVLGELGTVGNHLTAGYLAVAARDPDALQRTYEQRLADDSHSEQRGELLTAAGFVAGPAGIELARDALHQDPDPGVRLRAAFVLTAQVPDALGEKALHDLLDDRRIAEDRRYLGGVVMALQNLERAGMVNAIDRLGQRLRNLPLAERDRNQLELTLARVLPGGGRR